MKPSEKLKLALEDPTVSTFQKVLIVSFSLLLFLLGIVVELVKLKVMLIILGALGLL